MFTDNYIVRKSKIAQEGFHIFTTRAGARNYMMNGEKIVKVRYRCIVTQGTQSDYKEWEKTFGCVVAKEMYVEYNNEKGI